MPSACTATASSARATAPPSVGATERLQAAVVCDAAGLEQSGLAGGKQHARDQMLLCKRMMTIYPECPAPYRLLASALTKRQSTTLPDGSLVRRKQLRAKAGALDSNARTLYNLATALPAAGVAEAVARDTAAALLRNAVVLDPGCLLYHEALEAVLRKCHADGALPDDVWGPLLVGQAAAGSRKVHVYSELARLYPQGVAVPCVSAQHDAGTGAGAGADDNNDASAQTDAESNANTNADDNTDAGASPAPVPQQQQEQQHLSRRDLLERVAQLDPRNGAALADLACEMRAVDTARVCGKRATRLALLQRAVRLDKTDSSALLLLGCSLAAGEHADVPHHGRLSGSEVLRRAARLHGWGTTPCGLLKAELKRHPRCAAVTMTLGVLLPAGGHAVLPCGRRLSKDALQKRALALDPSMKKMQYHLDELPSAAPHLLYVCALAVAIYCIAVMCL